MWRGAVSALLLGAMVAAAGARWAEAAPCEGSKLPVVVEDGRQEIRLRIRVGTRMDPASIAVDLDGRHISISAREVDGQPLCSGSLALRSEVSEDQSVADYQDGWLTITLAKARVGDEVR